jgi:hypothetical protein
MSMSVTFDTLEATNKLIDAGYDRKKAESAVKMVVDSQQNIATKEYLHLELEKQTVKIVSTIGVMLAIVAAVIKLL